VRVVLDFDLVSDFIFVIVLLYSVKLVEQELWQKEEKGLIGVLPVRDSEAGAVGSLLSPGEIYAKASNFAICAKWWALWTYIYLLICYYFCRCGQ